MTDTYEALTARLADAQAMFEAGDIDGRQWARIKRTLDQRIRDVAANEVAAAKSPEQVAEIERLRNDPRLP